MTGLLTAFGLGCFYFISAIPAGMAAGAPVWLAALAAWLGYSTGAFVVLVAGAPLREWLLRTMKVNPTPDRSKLFWRVWSRFGLWGLGLIAPPILGSEIAAALALALGERAVRIQWALTIGVLPWVVAFAVLASLGSRLLQ